MAGTTDTVKAMLTPGEFVIRKEAVDMIGVPILEKLNDMPEAGGHSEIDRLIAMATLKNMTGMYGGGMINAKQYMGGGMVDMYGHGGKVKNQMMMGYKHGGEAHGNLKPVPDDNPGLAKLPEKVRNKMGYMQDGGSVLDMALRRAEPEFEDPEYQNLTNILDLQSPYAPLLFKIAEIKSKTDPKTGRYLSLGEEGYGKSVDTNKGILRKIREMDYAAKRGANPLGDSSEDVKKLIDLADKLGIDGMMKGGKAKKKKKMYGYQDGGSVQDSSMMRQPNPFVPFDQRPPSSGEVMSPIPRGMEQGDMMRIIRDEREVLDMEDAELIRQKAQNALTRFQIDSLMRKATLDSLINQAPPINEMLRSLPDFPTIENPPRPTKTEFLKELLREGVII